MVRRALEFATSDPKGPAYLMAAREVLEDVRIQMSGLMNKADKIHEARGPGTYRWRSCQPDITKRIARRR